MAQKRKKKTIKTDSANEKEPLVIDIEAAIRILETTPHERHVLDEESKRRIQEILDKIDSEEFEEDEITDASSNLDKYIYDPHFKKS